MHLASLLAVGSAETLFAAWDQRLRTGALAAGVQLVPPNQPARSSARAQARSVTPA